MTQPSLTISQIAHIVQSASHINAETHILYLSTDSRAAVCSANTLFFCIKGKYRDGHSFIDELIQKGISSFVVNALPEKHQYNKNVNFIVVQNVVAAIQQLSAYRRKQFEGTVIGITGSNGKTIVKEWLFYAMRGDRKIVRSPRSYNSQTGVPLSVWQLYQDADTAIFEAGISEAGEMKNLEQIIKPNIGIFTNIGEAHQENFSSIKEKIYEKAILFNNSAKIIYYAGNNDIDTCLKEKFDSSRLYGWSYNDNTFLKITSVEKDEVRTIVRFIYNNTETAVVIPFVDEASIENAIHVIAAMLVIGYPPEHISSRMRQLHQVEMRLEQKHGINNCTLINDSYNSDINSLSIAIDFLSMQKQHPCKTLILSDILQSGKNDDELYNEISYLIKKKHITRLIGIGPAISGQKKIFDSTAEFYGSTAEFLDSFNSSSFQNEAILIKGARSFTFEKITALLEKKTHKTVLEVNLTAINNNYNYFRSLLKSGTKIMAMVKAFSYGSGSYETAQLLEHLKADYLATAFADEGIMLRKAGITAPVMVMNTETEAIPQMIQYSLEPEIYCLSLLQKLHEYLEQNNIPSYPVHIKLDTGMNRLGFSEKDMDALLSLLQSYKNLNIRSVFSHLAAADNPLEDNFTMQQIKLFKDMAERIKTAAGQKPLLHILNSAGAERFPDCQFDMVRIGIGLYGISAIASQGVQDVSTLKTVISQLKYVPANNTVGYNRKWKSTHESVIAVIPVGYADGLRRELSNGKWKVFVNGCPAPIVGNICMDMCMADVTGIDVQEGDEVIIFGPNNPATEMAKALNTIPYEIFTGVSERVQRIYYYE